ncbi:MAG TPA: helix-turn-helix domain-containing protein [Pyrinomonadaceae bacterium]|jgi:hypothetical protein|nr:helix-turn-helix domain-containing protein [Pyrinomonadaceae bacterium]
MKRRTQITIEQQRLLLVSGRKLSAIGWCDSCGHQVTLVTAENAAEILRISARAIYRHIESGELHFIEIHGGPLLVCRESLEHQEPENPEYAMSKY